MTARANNIKSNSSQLKNAFDVLTKLHCFNRVCIGYPYKKEDYFF